MFLHLVHQYPPNGYQTPELDLWIYIFVYIFIYIPWSLMLQLVDCGQHDTWIATLYVTYITEVEHVVYQGISKIPDAFFSFSKSYVVICYTE